MSTEINKYVPLRQIVGYFLDENDKSSGSFDKAWLLAFRALVDIGLDMSFEPKTARIPKNANNTVNLPPDYISWSKIGVLNANGQVSTIKINPSLSKWGDKSPNRITDLAPEIPSNLGQFGIASYPYYLNFWNNGSFQPLFGAGSGLLQYGSCVFDEPNGVIVLDVNYPFDDVILEYLSSPEKDGDYRIDLCCQEAVIAFISWKFKLNNEQNYMNRKIEAHRRLKPIRIQEVQDAIRDTVGFKVKC